MTIGKVKNASCSIVCQQSISWWHYCFLGGEWLRTSSTFTHWDHCIGSNHRHLTDQSSDHEENCAAIYCDGFPEYTFENFRSKGGFSQSHPNRSAFSFNSFNSPSEAMGKIGKQNGTARDFLSSATCAPWNMDFSGFFLWISLACGYLLWIRGIHVIFISRNVMGVFGHTGTYILKATMNHLDSLWIFQRSDIHLQCWYTIGPPKPRETKVLRLPNMFFVAHPLMKLVKLVVAHVDEKVERWPVP